MWPFSKKSGRAGRSDRSPRDPFPQRAARFVRRLLWVCAAAVFIFFGYHLTLYIHHFVYRSDFFVLDQVRIYGAGEELESEARAKLAKLLDNEGDNLVRLNSRSLAAILGELPRARSARVTKTYPRTLSVDFEERHPLLVVNFDAPYLVDREGIVIAPADPQRLRELALPVLTGIRAGDYRLGDRIDQQRITEVLESVRFIQQNDEMLETRIVEWNLDSHDQITAILRSGTEVRFGSEHPLHLLDKLSAGLREKPMLEKARYIDLRMDTQIVYNMNG